MSRAPLLLLTGALLALCLCAAPVRAGDEKAPAPRPVAPPPAAPPEEAQGPTELVQVPTDEMDVLLRADSQGIVLRYAEYERLLQAARARAESLAAQPPVDGTLVSCEGALDLTAERAGRLELSYVAEVLADGPRAISFPLHGFAIEQIAIQDADGAPSGRYEEWKGRPRLRFDEAGRRSVTVRGSAAFLRKDAQRYLDLQLPPASAMAIQVRLPAGVEGVIVGEGPPTKVRAGPDVPLVVQTRPARDGRLRIAFAPRAEGGDAGPAILDATSQVLHVVGDGLVHTRVIVQTEVYRSPSAQLTLRVPADFAVRALEGKGVTDFRRSADGTRLTIDLAQPVLGPVALTLEGERPYRPGRVELAHVLVDGAIRDRAVMAVRFGADVRVRGLEVREGRRLPAANAKGQQDLLRYELSRASSSLAVDLEAGAVTTEALSTYYLNLAEAGKTLIATTTYRVLEGTVFSLRPRMPGGYELRTITIGGSDQGFNRDLRPDGTLEIALARGVPAGGEISLAVTLEQSQADWVADGEPVRVPLAVPAAGANREEGLVGIGADAAFQVLEAARADLVAVGAADLTARGISAAGLVYGYRLDGPRPAVTFNVQRREPLVEARIATTLLPAPRRLDVLSVVAHRIQRAGVRTLLVDVPAWTDKDQVRFESPFVRGAVMLTGAERPTDVPAGYERWRVDLNQRVIGRHAMVVRYHEDLPEENWSVPPTQALGVRVPLPVSERFVIVQRAEGLEVRLATSGADIRAVELSDLPAAAAIDPRRVLEALRLTNGGEGVGVHVENHAGAAVLDAVATRVELETAVAREGVLRTRAAIHLFNVDRQFLRVSLPRGSDLIGAIVARQAVKVLRDPDGVLMIPIPTARARGEITIATLTYETQLGAALGSRVRIPGPLLHDLEVLQTSHEVAFDPDVEIEQIRGAYGQTSLAASHPRRSWIASFFAGLAPNTWSATSKGAEMVSDGEASTADGAWDGGDAQQRAGEAYPRPPVLEAENINLRQQDATEEWQAESARASESSRVQERAKLRREAEKRPSLDSRTPVPNARSPSDPTPSAPPPPTTAPTPVPTLGVPATRAPAAKPQGPTTPGFQLPRDAAKSDGPARAGRPRAGGGPPVADPNADGYADAEGRAAEADDFHEGDLPGWERSGRQGARGRRKGLLSLDVPVVLGPNRLVAERLGQGGVIEIDLSTEQGSTHRFQWILLALTTIGLLAGVGSRARKVGTLLGGVGLVLLSHWILGPEGNTFVVALWNALTLLALLWSVRALAAKWRQRRQAVPVARKAAAALLVLFTLGLGLAGPAHADEPRPPVPDVKPPKQVFVPYDPAHPEDVKASDRIFLPLDTYLRLFRAAHPEQDPELVRLGRMVSIVDAAYELDVERATGEMASGSASWRFAKRGSGTLLVAWPLAGIAVTEATLDGEPVRLLLDKGVYRIAVREPGDHRLALRFRVPVLAQPDGRHLSFQVPAFARGALTVRAPAFEGDVRVSGAGRIETSYTAGAGEARDCRATAWLGRRRKIDVALLERSPDELPATVRTRAESRTIHSLRDAGTETESEVTLYVLQGRAPFVDFALAPGVQVLQAQGPNVVRWDVLGQPQPRVRLVFDGPVTGAQRLTLRTFRAAAGPTRLVDLPDLPVLDTTGESGETIVNAEPSMRVEVRETENLFRIARPEGAGFTGADQRGRVMGAWRFAARPSRLQVSTRGIDPRVDIDTEIAVLFGDDRVRSTLRAQLVVDPRAAVGTFVFELPGEDEVRAVQSAGLDTWWLEGEQAERRLFVRYRDLRTGRLGVEIRLERRLGGARESLAVPRLSLRGARRDQGRLALYALPDVELRTGSLAGLKPLPPGRSPVPPPAVDGARAIHAYAWEAPLGESLPVGLREPELELEATVISVVTPGDEEHRLDHLVLFEVRRGSTDRLRLFVPDGGPDAASARGDVVTTRDVREMRRLRVTRKDVDGADVPGTLYDIQLQSVRDGVLEVTVSQVWRSNARSPRPVRLVRPEGVTTTHWFSLVRKFLDGEVQVDLLQGKPDTQVFDSLPFVPARLQEGDVYRSYAGRAPYLLQVDTVLRGLVTQAEAVVQSADATVVLGRDGAARIRVDYRVFNRSRQFLRLRLPEGALLFGATTAGRPVKPLAGKGGSILLPIQKVPLGGNGYPVSVLYRARAGGDLDAGGPLEVLLPEVADDVQVDRTVVRLYVPDGYAYDFESTMTPSDADDVAAQLADVAIREARSLLQLSEKGTLEQRFNATQNGLELIAQARTRLDQVPESTGRYRALVGELNQLSSQLGKNNESVQQDVAAAQRGQQVAAPSMEEFASNARNLVQLDEDSNGPAGQAAGALGNDGAVADKNKAGWVVNPNFASEGKSSGGKKDAANDAYRELQDRLTKGFRTRADRERRKNVQSVVGQAEQAGAGSEDTRAAYEGGQVLDAKQVKWLNDTLKQEQVRNRQLGAVDTTLLNGAVIDGAQFENSVAYVQDLDMGEQVGQLLQLERQALSADNYGMMESAEAGAGSGDFRGRSETVFHGSRANPSGFGFGSEPEPSSGPASRDSGIFYGDEINLGRYATASGKVGKMGVDVELPRAGQVYYFRSLSGSAPIRIEADKEGRSLPARVVTLLLLLGVIAVSVHQIRRRLVRT